MAAYHIVMADSQAVNEWELEFSLAVSQESLHIMAQSQEKCSLSK